MFTLLSLNKAFFQSSRTSPEHTHSQKKNYETLCFYKPTWHGLDFTCNFPETVLRLASPRFTPNKANLIALRAYSGIRKASCFVITTEPIGFVLTK